MWIMSPPRRSRPVYSRRVDRASQEAHNQVMADTSQPTISDLANSAEAALAQYGNDQSTVTSDQQKITTLQAQLASDQDGATTDGGTAAKAVQDLITALQAILFTLPQPAPAPVPAPVPVPAGVPYTPSMRQPGA